MQVSVSIPTLGSHGIFPPVVSCLHSFHRKSCTEIWEVDSLSSPRFIMNTLSQSCLWCNLHVPVIKPISICAMSLYYRLMKLCLLHKNGPYAWLPVAAQTGQRHQPRTKCACSLRMHELNPTIFNAANDLKRLNRQRNSSVINFFATKTCCVSYICEVLKRFLRLPETDI